MTVLREIQNVTLVITAERHERHMAASSIATEIKLRILLLSGARPRPIQCQRGVFGVSQPLRDVFYLERAFLNVQITIDQLGDLASGAWFPDLVQRSQNVLAETTTRIRNLLHRWFHRLEELTQLRPVMSASGAEATRTVW